MRPALVVGLLLVLRAHAYRDSDNVGHLTSAEDLHRDPEATEGPHDTVKSDKEEEDAPPDCPSKFTALRNWVVDFIPLEEKIREFVRVPTKEADAQDPFGGLVGFEGEGAEKVLVRLGAKITFVKEDKDCKLKPEVIRFSSSPSCEPGGKHLNTTEADFLDGHMQFFMMTDPSGAVVLQRELMGNDTDASLEGDWTFEKGDFTVKKDGEKLMLEQKFWNSNFVYSGEVAAADAKDYHHIDLGLEDKECLKYKDSDCPELSNGPHRFCNVENGQCKAVKGGHGHLRLQAKPPNELLRDESLDNKTWERFAAHRSFTPADAELSGFVCVFTNESWIPIRGITFKQISGMSPLKNLAKSASSSDSFKELYANLSYGREWLQEKHLAFQLEGNGKQFLPPWRKALQGTVEWKKAGVCPGNYPLCMKDGSCALQECQSGCEWSRAPHPWDDPSGGYNYISGYDSLGTECDIDFPEAAEPKNGAVRFAAFSAVAALAALAL